MQINVYKNKLYKKNIFYIIDIIKYYFNYYFVILLIKIHYILCIIYIIFMVIFINIQ